VEQLDEHGIMTKGVKAFQGQWGRGEAATAGGCGQHGLKQILRPGWRLGGSLKGQGFFRRIERGGNRHLLRQKNMRLLIDGRSRHISENTDAVAKGKVKVFHRLTIAANLLCEVDAPLRKGTEAGLAWSPELEGGPVQTERLGGNCCRGRKRSNKT